MLLKICFQVWHAGLASRFGMLGVERCSPPAGPAISITTHYKDPVSRLPTEKIPPSPSKICSIVNGHPIVVRKETKKRGIYFHELGKVYFHSLKFNERQMLS